MDDIGNMSLECLKIKVEGLEAKVLAMEARLKVASMTEPEKIALIGKCAKAGAD